MTIRYLLTLLTCLVLAACGGDDQPQMQGGAATQEENANPDEPLPLPERTGPSEQEVIDALGIRAESSSTEVPPPGYEIRGDEPYFPTAGGLYHPESDCQISQILLGQEQIALYASEGDAIATDPERTVGLELAVDRDRYPEAAERCHAALTEALQEL